MFCKIYYENGTYQIIDISNWTNEELKIFVENVSKLNVVKIIEVGY